MKGTKSSTNDVVL